jgi:hypothetical protein
MGNGTKIVNVNFNYNSGTPSWDVPNKVTVNHGDIDTLKWTLACTGIPQGSNGRFSLTNPVQFVTNKPGISNQSTWTGPAPSRQNDSLVTVTDDNTSNSSTQDYYYSVSVDVVDGNNNVTTFTKDPEIENPGG